jgi:hypothetical protein
MGPWDDPEETSFVKMVSRSRKFYPNNMIINTLTSTCIYSIRNIYSRKEHNVHYRRHGLLRLSRFKEKKTRSRTASWP